MGFFIKIVLILVAMGGIGLGNIGLGGDSPESIALGVCGVIAAFISITFLFKFLWRFLGCLSTILFAVVIVVILLILTGTFDPVVAKIKAILSGEPKTQTEQPAMQAVPVAIVGADGNEVYAPAVVNAPQSVSSGELGGVISGIRSGSQFFIDDFKITLFGIESPEPNQICSDRRGRPYECGKESIRQLRKFTGGSLLDCKTMGRRGDGSWFAAVCNINNNDLGAAMVSAGWALANVQESKVYLPYQQVAIDNRSGLWGGQFYTPSEWRQRQRHQANEIRENSGGSAIGEILGGIFK